MWSFAMKSILKLSILTALFLGLSISTSAQQRSNDADRPRIDRQEQMKKMHANQRQHRPARMIMRLDLNEEQTKQIEEIRLSGQKEMLPLRNLLREKNARLQTLTTSEKYDQSAVDQIVDEISEIRADMLSMRITHRQQIREILTEEQRIKFDAHQSNSNKRQPRFGM